MKFNKKLLAVFVSLTFIFALNLSAEAQKRRTSVKKRTTAQKKRRTIKPPPTANVSEVSASAEKVSTQIKNLSKFLYSYGGIARGIEEIDAATRTKKVSQTTLEKNNQFKLSVRQSIRNLRAGLAALEVEFRTNPALKNYLFYIQGINDLSGRAEDLAIDGRFTESGKSLLLVVEKLSDTLSAMP